MGGSESKQPVPSSKDGKVRDPDVERLIRERGMSREVFAQLLRRAAKRSKR